jgi:hypothetical protein
LRLYFKEKAGHVAPACHTSYDRKHKIGRSQEPWAKSEILSQKQPEKKELEV